MTPQEPNNLPSPALSNSARPSNPTSPRLIHNMQEWLNLELTAAEKDVVIGSPDNAIVRPGTKNLIEASEKSYKTTFLLRLLAGMASGETVYPELPVTRSRRVLYLHGELSNAEIKDRTLAAAKSLISQPSPNFWQGRVLDAHLIEEAGRAKVRELVEEYMPDDLALDPWQSFIIGHEENGYKDMSEATNFCSKLIEEYGVTLWIPIHLGKDRSKGARGHSIIAGWRDTRMQLQRDGVKLTITIDPRWGTPPNPFNLRFRNGTLWPDVDTEFTEQHTRIREFLRAEGGRCTVLDLRSRLQLSPDAFRKAMSRAEGKGAIVRSEEYVSLPIEPSSETEGGSIQ